MSIYLVVKTSSGVVENAIEWDGESEYDAGNGNELIAPVGQVWIGWTRNSEGIFEPPPPPVYVRYAVVKKLGGLVVDFKLIEEGRPASLGEPASFEYQLVACPDETVEAGATYEAGAFTKP